MKPPVTLLIVDDDDIDAEAIRRAFLRQNRSNPLYRAVSGIDALQQLRGENGREKIPQPCLLFVDLNMPQMNGLELLQEIRNDPQLRHLLIFMLTTSDREEDRDAAYALHVAGYIVKQKVGHDFLQLVDLVAQYERLVSFPPGEGP